MWIGLSLLTIGFCLQIVSNGLNYVQGGSPLHKAINTEITTNNIKNIKPPVMAKNEVGELPQNAIVPPAIQNKSQEIPLKEPNTETLQK